MKRGRSRGMLPTRTKKAPSFRSGLFWLSDLGYADALGARALRARLDFERNLLAALQSIEVTFGATAVEKVFLSVLGLDKSKATIRNQLLDGACRHLHLLSLERRATQLAGPFEIDRSLQ